MFAIIGIVVVFGAVAGGYLMEHGNMRVLLQPAELLIIGGAGMGTVLIANPLHILKDIADGVGGVFRGSSFTKQRYLDTLKMMYDLLNKARKDGLMALESDVEEPEKSAVFSKPARSFSRTITFAISFAIRCAWQLPGWKRSISIRCWNSTWKSTTTMPASPPPL